MPKAKPSEIPALSAQEKPDLRSLLKALPKEELDALLERLVPDFPGRMKRAEQAGRHKAYAREQAEQYRRSQANQTIQDTLRNLAMETFLSLPLPPLPPSSNRP